MTWTYDTALTASRDQVRFYSGDTDTNAQQVQDEEIAFALTREANVVLAAALVCEHLAGKYAARSSKTVGPLRIEQGELRDHFAAKAAELRRLATREAVPTFGGQSKAEVTTAAQDTDLVQPSFRVGMLDRPDQSATTEES